MPAVKNDKIWGENKKKERLYPHRYVDGCFKVLGPKGSNKDRHAIRLKELDDVVTAVHIFGLCVRMQKLRPNKGDSPVRVYRKDTWIRGRCLRDRSQQH